MTGLVFTLVLVPFIAALAIWLIRARAIRNALVLLTGGALIAASITLVARGLTFSFDPGSLGGVSWDQIITVADFALLALILFYGLKLKSPLILAFTVVQVGLLAWFEFGMLKHGGPTFAPIHGDSLALILVLIISIVGSLICFFGLPYMRKHEEHLQLTKSREPRFFFFMVLFLGAMNGLVLSNNLLWLYFFFEVTTFCSFMLIRHDETQEAVQNAARALWMNSLGGLAFVGAMILAYRETGTLDIQAVVATGAESQMLLAALALFAVAGFTKAAQLPFQGWLLGAMVAPTPVSALLHSSTMVKAGVYVVLRFAPAIAGTWLSAGLAVCGAFTFMACAALAVSQRNGKRILAYSTVSNLGLIMACAGINTEAAYTAAILLILFHAVSKSLLFLCVGTIEQEIGSRDIEDMRGLFRRMPRTAVITITGILSMLLPPFGVLISKWMAIEAASTNVIVVSMVALGSALTVVYWARWAGLLMGSRPAGGPCERQPIFIMAPLMTLCAATVLLSLATPLVYSELIEPLFRASAPFAPGSTTSGVLSGPMGAFAVYPVFLVLAVGFMVAVGFMRKTGKVRYTQPYLSGIQTEDEGGFTGPMNQPVPTELGNYYLPALFGEGRLTRFVNVTAILLIVIMVGLAMKGGAS